MTLLLAGAMASLETQHIEAARNLGARRLRVLVDIVLPQVRGTLLVGLVLSFVTMLSVLSVPMMINPNSPTMITVDVAYRISTLSDYAVANALCLMSLVVAAGGAWFYLRHASAATRMIRFANSRWPQMIGDGRSCSGSSRSSIFGPLANLFLWAFAEKWYFPNKIPQEFGFSFWARVFSPRGGALASLGTSVWIALLTVVLSLARRDPRRLRARAAEAALARPHPARVPAAAGRAQPAGVREHRARVLRDRARTGRSSASCSCMRRTVSCSRCGSRRRRSRRSIRRWRRPRATWARRRGRAFAR